MKIALLTCQNFPDLYRPDRLLIPALAKYGIHAEPATWDDSNVNWTGFDCLLFRSTWDYFEKEASFDSWLDHIRKLNIPTLNPIEIIRRNKHKFYLRELREKGVCILPSVFIEKTQNLELSELIPLHWKKAVIKPAVSGGGYQTAVFDISDIDTINEKYRAIAAQKDLLLQEFMPEIQTLGETSFIFFNKEFSHCVNKKPADGDFRVQVQFGGKYTGITATTELIGKAEEIIALFPQDLLYARVDGIIINDTLHLMEIECIEPDLYLNLSDGATERFVSAIASRLKKSTNRQAT